MLNSNSRIYTFVYGTGIDQMESCGIGFDKKELTLGVVECKIN